MIPIMLLSIGDESDRSFFERLYMDYRLLMLRKAYAILNDYHEAEDAMNMAWLALLKKITLLRKFDSCSLRSYIVSTIRHTSLNLLRQKRCVSIEDMNAAFDVIPSNEPELDERLLQKDAVDELMRFLECLPKRDLLILEMKYVRELPDEEIARELNIKQASVRTYLMRARRKAKKVLKEKKRI